ncbi:DUF3597 domain-containing protein [Novosphingobium sp. JCM 18896]|uniref:DUF3597 domain-containing protein n=1 Tax=Novosphingobium sp. JCM 18896 TaxID=2989731 RepID=UPI002221CAEF|nr:DUF3597 domain-containing protein [Novosphingobium sp. JCM 18896]MCW1432193.1 DUF3597 domain-containing protein [Novosphingobium sp. JCM 18896]
MSIFGNILDKIFHHDSAKSAPVSAVSASPAPAPSAATSAATPTAPPPGETAPADTPVDVGAVLEAMAAMKSDHGGNYKTSIVDLLKLLDLDSSLAARKDLGDELGVDAGTDGSAEQNIALHRAVIEKLAENGGLVPDSLRQ